MPLVLRTALRALRRRPADALINGLGLALGLACCALIALHVAAERGADRQHAGGERVVRVGIEMTDAGGEVTKAPTVPRPLLAAVERDPAAEAVATVRYGAGFRVERPVGNVRADAIFASADVLDVLNGYRLIAGDAQTALAAPGSVVLTEEAALRLTGEAAPLGQTLDVGADLPYTVTGVFDETGRSHLAFDALVSFATLDAADWYDPDQWQSFDLGVYARLRSGADRAAFAGRVQGALDDGIGEGMRAEGMAAAAAVQPLHDVYLAEDGRMNPPYVRTGHPALLRVLSLVGLFVLAVAAVNFVNLATARSVERAREVGVRKAVGAGRGGLVAQFLAEAVALALASGAVALALVALALPAYNGLTDAGLALSDLLAPAPLAAGLAVVVAVGLLAGAYPALALSSFRPAETLRGSFATDRRGAGLRRGLVVFQFAVSGALLVATLVVGSQLGHLRDQDPGFDREHVVLVPTNVVGGADVRALKDAFARVPGVEAVALTGAPPTEAGWESQNVSARGGAGGTQTMETVIADPDYAEALGLRVVAGRDLSAEIETDRETAVLLNASAARALGWTPEEAVGQEVETSGRYPGTVVGVLADYAHHGLAAPPRPQVFFDQAGQAQWAAIRLAPGATGALDRLRAVWEGRVPGDPFAPTFLDAAVDAQYRAEEQLARAFALFAGLAVVVACLGLFGLAAHAVQKRRKEVGVRRVLGATVGQVVGRLTADFARPVLVGLAVAVPVAWWGLSRWLDGFAERVALTPAPFLVAGLVALAVAVLTVSVHTVRAATADPARALRSE
ncbi:ABC transporter permease [Rubrivirga litoralis]|uniref:ABC transporter permease n=1 Tax=Rubrivirga litoralis TaxID=3075598 RepID=A0ABU3BTJ5_9BACT|nr:ABC transporter permease [Rubrivirga sp. F394]MDT0632555.1 ABC transporter permease [Rubrivirga sp. F394]